MRISLAETLPSIYSNTGRTFPDAFGMYRHLLSVLQSTWRLYCLFRLLILCADIESERGKYAEAEDYCQEFRVPRDLVPLHTFRGCIGYPRQKSIEKFFPASHADILALKKPPFEESAKFDPADLHAIP